MRPVTARVTDSRGSVTGTVAVDGDGALVSALHVARGEVVAGVRLPPPPLVQAAVSTTAPGRHAEPVSHLGTLAASWSRSRGGPGWDRTSDRRIMSPLL